MFEIFLEYRVYINAWCNALRDIKATIENPIKRKRNTKLNSIKLKRLNTVHTRQFLIKNKSGLRKGQKG